MVKCHRNNINWNLSKCGSLKFLSTTNVVRGKVMFSQVCVISVLGEGKGAISR